MLDAMKDKSRKINDITYTDKGWILSSEMGKYRICPIKDDIVRVSYTLREEFSNDEKPGVINNEKYDGWELEDVEDSIVFCSSKLKLVIDSETASFAYYDKEGKLLLKEREHESISMEEFQSYITDENSPMKVEAVNTPDGVKNIVKDAGKIEGKKFFHTRINYEWQEDEALYGLGQQEEGILNLRGHIIYLHQANRKIAVPMLLSSKGYGVLYDTYSPMIFCDNEYGSYIYTEADEEVDYYFIAGKDLNEVVKGYRSLTGKAAMLPKWAFGYIQSKERYETAEEIVATAKEYKDRGLGLSCIVLDWLSWGDGQWGQKSFDNNRFPDPAEMIRKLHEMDVKFMISIWPNMCDITDNYKEMKAAGNMLIGSEIYNALKEDARKMYWKQAYEGLFRYGVDSWWCDSSEPLTIEWVHKERMEPGLMYAEYVKELGNIMPVEKSNSFALYHAMSVYDGQRGVTEEKRVCNLTRSGYTGQQRFGTILWSGDTDASWDTYRKQIAVGLNFVATGLPYWTVDIGAFFVKNGNCWFWKGDYDDTTDDMGYVELYTRWFQWGAMLPVFRAHGTDCHREMWVFEKEDNRFFEAMKAVNELRYKLLPYIYAQAGNVWLNGASMMKMLAFDFGNDTVTFNITDQYMLGESIMVCPVTEPMYYDKGSVDISDRTSKTRRVYLPEGTNWYDFYTMDRYAGGQWIEAFAPIDIIPLFVREGSIIPMDNGGETEWKVYPGRDAVYMYYEDAGDGYAYEDGEYSLKKVEWNEKEQKLYLP